MVKQKLIELVLAAISAIVAAARAVIKFISTIGKMKPAPEPKPA